MTEAVTLPPATPPPSTPPPAEGPKSFLDGLPEDLRGDKALQSFKDAGSLAKSYVEAQKLIGSSIRVPKADAKPEEWTDVWTKLGRPASSEGYAPTRPALHPAISWDEPMEKDFLAVSHKVGLNGPQVQALLDWYGRALNTNFAAASEGVAHTLETLQTEWGGAFPRNLALGQRIVKEYGGDELVTFLNETGMGNHPAVVRFMAKVGHALAEEGIISGHLEGLPNPEEALIQAKTLMADQKSPYWDAKHPLHEETVQKVKGLYEIAFPNVK